MPFSKHCSVVSGILHVLWQECLVDRHAPRGIPVNHIGLRPDPDGVATRHEGASGRAADWLNVVLTKNNTAQGELVKMISPVYCIVQSVRARACVRARARACVRACVRVYVHVCVCGWVGRWVQPGQMSVFVRSLC